MVLGLAADDEAKAKAKLGQLVDQLEPQAALPSMLLAADAEWLKRNNNVRRRRCSTFSSGRANLVIAKSQMFAKHKLALFPFLTRVGVHSDSGR